MFDTVPTHILLIELKNPNDERKNRDALEEEDEQKNAHTHTCILFRLTS